MPHRLRLLSLPAMLLALACGDPISAPDTGTNVQRLQPQLQTAPNTPIQQQNGTSSLKEVDIQKAPARPAVVRVEPVDTPDEETPPPEVPPETENPPEQPEDDAPPAPQGQQQQSDGFLLPFACGFAAPVTQGNSTSGSHKGTSAFSVDFGVPKGTPVHASQMGTVTAIFDATGPGDDCYNGGGSSCINFANYVTIQHDDGTDIWYAHLETVLVKVGDKISQGQLIGKTGSTGYSTGPHLHVQRQNHCGSGWCPSIAMEFEDFPGGVPKQGDKATSKNCP